jgi:VWFA-related protein
VRSRLDKRLILRVTDSEPRPQEAICTTFQQSLQPVKDFFSTLLEDKLAADELGSKRMVKLGAGLLAVTLLAQNVPQFSARSSLVFLPTRVQTKKGDTIYGLKPEQFIVEDNGVRQTVNVDEDPETSGLSLVVAVECGRSAALEFNKLKGLGAMIGGIVGDAPHEVAIVSYGIGPYLLSDFSRSSDAVGAGLAKLKDCKSNGAATIDTVYYAINMLKRRQNHYRKAILLIGETRDHGSKSKLSEVVAELGVTDTVIYFVAFSPGRDEALHDMMHANDKYYEEPPKDTRPPPDVPKPEIPPESVWKEKNPLFPWPPQFLLIANALRKNAASEIASLSGGHYANFTTQKGFDQELHRISNEIHNYYLLSFKAAADPQWGLHSLKVRVDSYPSAVIQTRKSYWAGMPEPR